MLQSMRDNLKGTAAVIVAAFFGFIMVIGGIDFFGGASGGRAGEAASVNGEKISNLDLSRAIQNRRSQIMRQYGENVPSDMLTDERLREPVLQQLVNGAVMRQAARDGGMAISTQELDREIVQIPAFQLGGKFDPQTYRNALRRMGYSAASFRGALESDLTLQQYTDAVTGSAFTTQSGAEQVVAISMAERDFDYVIFPVQELLDEVTVDDSEVEEYYAGHQAEFQRPEQVAIEYIDLRPELFAAKVNVSEEDVRAQYDQEVADFQASTRRHAAHILLAEGSKDKVAEVQAKLDSGADFAELAKTYSDDPGSSEQGGDLGFTSGDIFPAAFEEALAALEVGQVSGPVVTDSGTHFIKLLEIDKAEVPSFEERKPTITTQLRNAAAEGEFVDALGRLADLAYNAEDLSGPAQALGVPLETTALFGREGGTGITANSKVKEAAFAPEVMLDGNTSDVLSLGESRAVVLRVTEHKPAGTYPLEEVRTQIVDRLKRDKASEQLAARAEQLEAQLQAGGDFAELAKAANLTMETSDNTRRGGFGQRGEIIDKAFSLKAPSSGENQVVTFATSDGDQVVLKLRAARPGELSSQSREQRTALMQQLGSMIGNAELAAVRNYHASNADIEIAKSE